MKKSILVLAFGAALFSACGGGEVKTETTETPTQEAPAEEPAAKEVVELSISGNDQMKYDKTSLEVKAGTRVKLTFNNVGTMPKESMGHNWTLLSKDADLVAYSQASMTAVDNDYQAPDLYQVPIVYTKMLGPGESETIEFDAPAAGTYKFVCTFPGHYAMMQGDFIVTE